VPPSSISIRHNTPLHPSIPDRPPKDESISQLYPKHKSDTTEKKEMPSIKSCGTSTLIHRVDELLDDASSVMRDVDARFAAADDTAGLQFQKPAVDYTKGQTPTR
jgi:hypothetical protein